MALVDIQEDRLIVPLPDGGTRIYMFAGMKSVVVEGEHVKVEYNDGQEDFTLVMREKIPGTIEQLKDALAKWRETQNP